MRDDHRRLKILINKPIPAQEIEGVAIGSTTGIEASRFLAFFVDAQTASALAYGISRHPCHPW
jgi:hypothetical protein